jgi:hypothetical protein
MDREAIFRRIYVIAKCIMLFGPLPGVALWLLLYKINGSGSLLGLLLMALPPLAFGSISLILAAMVEALLERNDASQRSASS